MNYYRKTPGNGSKGRGDYSMKGGHPSRREADVVPAKNGRKKGKKKVPNYVFLIIGVVALAALGVALVHLIGTYQGDQASVQEYDALADSFGVSTQQQTLESTDSVAFEDMGLGEVAPSDPETINFDIKFDDLMEINDETVGWIYVHDTVVNYPIVQDKENAHNDKYVSTTFEGETYSEANPGAIFMDHRNSPDFSDKNTVIYGHNMYRTGRMFHALTRYEDQEFFDSHKLSFIITPDEIYKMEIFSVFVTNYNVPYRTMTFKTDEEFMDFIEEYQGQSMVETDVEVTAKDKIVTLSTCTYEYQDARLAVMAKITPFDPETDEIA